MVHFLSPEHQRSVYNSENECSQATHKNMDKFQKNALELKNS